MALALSDWSDCVDLGDKGIWIVCSDGGYGILNLPWYSKFSSKYLGGTAIEQATTVVVYHFFNKVNSQTMLCC